MSVYTTKVFSRFARKAGLENEALLEAARSVLSGHWDADLGGGVFKQRVARAGESPAGSEPCWLSAPAVRASLSMGSPRMTRRT